MHDVHQFTYGAATPVIAYLAAVVGSASGLSATSRARVPAPWQIRSAWLFLAAFCLGGTGIWAMHFVGMMGFSITGMPIAYDLPRTILSAAVAILVVAIGLHMVVLVSDRPVMLIGGGMVAGLGVAAMHYLGISAMRLHGELHHNPIAVGAAVLIALVAATVALWLCVNTRGRWATIGAALIMGVAVAGMHFTGMAGITVTGTPGDAPAGTPGFQLMGPMIIGGGVIVILMVVLLIAAPTEEELEEHAQWERERKRARAAVGA